MSASSTSIPSLLHANVRGDFDRFGHFMATPRFHHWHHALEAEGVDKNFAIHFPLFDRLFGTFHMPPGRWPENYGVPEAGARRAISASSSIRSGGKPRRGRGGFLRARHPGILGSSMSTTALSSRTLG